MSGVVMVRCVRGSVVSCVEMCEGVSVGGVNSLVLNN